MKVRVIDKYNVPKIITQKCSFNTDRVLPVAVAQSCTSFRRNFSPLSPSDLFVYILWCFFGLFSCVITQLLLRYSWKSIFSSVVVWGPSPDAAEQEDGFIRTLPRRGPACFFFSQKLNQFSLQYVAHCLRLSIKWSFPHIRHGNIWLQSAFVMINSRLLTLLPLPLQAFCVQIDANLKNYKIPTCLQSFAPLCIFTIPHVDCPLEQILSGSFLV